jgi:hypothetical protein
VLEVRYHYLYVDDIIVTSSSKQAITSLLKDLNDDFAIKDHSDLHFFLGIEVNKVQDDLILTHQKYASDILHKVNMHICKSASTPSSSNGKLSLVEGEPLGSEDSTKYRNIVGDLHISP